MTIVVLVPGYGGPARFVERWRMKVAERTVEAYGGGFLVVSGHKGEADRLRDLASPGTRVVVEPAAVSTEENVERSLPSLAGAECVAIATDRVHRRRAEAILRRLDPALADRLVQPRYTPLEGVAMDAGGALYEVIRRLRRAFFGIR